MSPATMHVHYAVYPLYIIQVHTQVIWLYWWKTKELAKNFLGYAKTTNFHLLSEALSIFAPCHNDGKKCNGSAPL